MAEFLDFIKNRNAPAQAPAAQTPQPTAEVSRSVESLPANVKSQAVEAAKPVADIAGSGAVPKDVPVQPQSAATPARGRSLGWER